MIQSLEHAEADAVVAVKLLAELVGGFLVDFILQVLALIDGIFGTIKSIGRV